MRLFRRFLIVALLALLAMDSAASTGLAAAYASPPRITTVRPVGGQRGTDVEVTVIGQRLTDVKEFVFHQPGVTVVSITPKDAGQFQAVFRIAPDCQPGLRDFRIRTAGGLSGLRVFSVGALPEILEKEPNNDFAKPQPIDIDRVVNGVASQEDIDYFVIRAKKGERISAEVEGIRLGLTLFDPYVAILDANRYELATSDDAAMVRQDAVASIVAPEDGSYIIAVRESAYAGNNDCLYRLHVGHYPRPRAFYPMGGKAGETLKAKWLGDVLGDREALIPLPSQPSANLDFLAFARDEQGVQPDGHKIRVSEFGNVLEAEPNDDHAEATPFEAPLALNGIIAQPGDIDSFRFRAKRGQQYHVKVWARALGSPLDPVMTIARLNGGNLAANDDLGGPDSYLKFSAPADGEYVITIRDHLKKGGADYVYRIELSPIRPVLNISPTPESPRRGFAVVALSVPRGNRQSILITGQRLDFGGDLAFSADGLPQGVSHAQGVMTSNINAIPIVFEAASDAPLASSLMAIRGAAVDGKTQVASRFSHMTTLVYGQNNINFYDRTVDKIAIAVADEAPYSIDVVEPKVPLVRNGQMELKVVANRKPGFDKEIVLNVPWTPPGVSAVRNVSIPAGKNEATITVNANSGAPIQTWSMVVDGINFDRDRRRGQGGQVQRAPDEPGPVRVSSRLFKLSIAQPFVSFAYKPISVEQGKTTQLPVEISKLADFDGEATVELKGLPNLAVAEPRKIVKTTEELVFPISTDKTSPAGTHKNLFCQVTVLRDGEPIVHNLGYATLRIDAPLPPKPNAPKADPKAAAKGAKPSEKPLTRLEKLRLEAKERMLNGGADKN